MYLLKISRINVIANSTYNFILFNLLRQKREITKMKALIVLAILLALCATQKQPESTKINDYIDECKKLISSIHHNITFISNFTLTLNDNIKKYLKSPKLSGAIERSEKNLLKKYKGNEKAIKKCFENKNSEKKSLSLKIKNKKDKCRKNSKIVFKQIQDNFSKITETGELLIKSISLKTQKCLEKYAENEENCIKCLSEKREQMTDQVNTFSEQFNNLIEDVLPSLEYSTGLISVCVIEAQQYIKTNEKLINHNLEECAKKASK